MIGKALVKHPVSNPSFASFTVFGGVSLISFPQPVPANAKSPIEITALR
jgi:hypothetical protein